MIAPDIPADVIVRCQKAAWKGGCTPELVFRILRAAGWPEVVAERDRQVAVIAQLQRFKWNDGQIALLQGQNDYQYALIAELTAGLREAQSLVQHEMEDAPKLRREIVARINALLAKVKEEK